MIYSRFLATMAALFVSAGVASASDLSLSVSSGLASGAATEFSAPELSMLTLQNGIAAGKALLALFNQYKSSGKLDLANATNLSNLVSLVNNVKGLTGTSTVASTPADFINGLISGSGNLVTNNNSNTVLSTLGSLAGLDTNSIAKSAASAASSAAASAASSAIGKLLGGSKTTSSSTASSNSAASMATSLLTGLFSSFKN